MVYRANKKLLYFSKTGAPLLLFWWKAKMPRNLCDITLFERFLSSYIIINTGQDVKMALSLRAISNMFYFLKINFNYA
jgi:hypothetical protein